MMTERNEAVFRELAEVASEHSARLYWVGGGVRDFLLNGNLADYDFLVSERLEEIAAEMARRVGGRTVIHDRFLHVVIDVPNGGTIDLGLPRCDRYPSWGALPEVKCCSLEDDLRRRDFTVNALAWSILPDGGFGELVDVLDGRTDLKSSVLRIHHESSFLEDPTRLLRMLRFELRLGFQAEPWTFARAEDASRRGALAWANPSRLRRELLRIARERFPIADAVARMGEFGWIDSTSCERAVAHLRIATAASERIDPWRLLLLVLVARVVPGVGPTNWLARIPLTGAERRWLNSAVERVSALVRMIRNQEPFSRVFCQWSAAHPEELATVRALLGEAGVERYQSYAERMELSRANLSGAALLSKGAVQGPALGRALACARTALLDGTIGPGEELEYAWRIWQAESEAGGERNAGRPRSGIRRSGGAFLFLASMFLSSLSASADARSREILRQECNAGSSRRELTVFENGTVRLRLGDGQREELLLLELSVEELASFRSVLSELDLSRTPTRAPAPSGAGTELCRLRLLWRGSELFFEYSPLSTPSLELGTLASRIATLEERVRLALPATELASDYRPLPGDRLEHRSGVIYEVRMPTADGKGIELVGVDQPVVLYVALADLRSEFVRVVSRRSSRRP